MRFLTAEGWRKLHGRHMLGQPDMIFRGERVIVFVDGCFWHGCQQCGRARPDMAAHWLEKISGTMKRDAEIGRQLRQQGWEVVRVPEHSVRTRVALDETAGEITKILRAMLREEKRS
jgi:DNA mismatch endonuclease (patch repair protein)